ncbi:MAG: hypothetical protein ABSH01_00975 [Terriglobia bacterium]|jgi:hypothetical protein
MTNEKREEALRELEHTYDQLCAQAKDVVHRMCGEADKSKRDQFQRELTSIDHQRTNVYAKMDALWESS